ncbi:outer membrane protein assembly factor BamB family protein [Halopiger xanaduensis]|uniref:Pyrrolo-quinoline quinone beta-propeller repeat-containing protein n=1 Tax=Halopiger xanaduensis (strain DSM 18323 / JCM 14033 / SH-6) TaxID=797210 RepID=F8D4F4_HALXS|nr:PQQ-binding-like beta-propeller repeat protein [Halopiger xanaduensis]AEH38698.1 Pyrrolo-quinoline quinone beta-propeller repeat-containing protein [Halopiger xanaduensis SH-6]
MRDEGNTGATEATVPPRGNLAWTSDAFTRWPPVVADGTVYIGNVDQNPGPKIVALDATDGSERWRVSIDEASDYTSAVVGTLLVAAYGDQVIALDRDSGTQEWTATLSGTVNLSTLTAVPEETLVLVPERSRRDAGLTAFDTTSGEQRWSAPLADRVVDAPAVRGDGVYVATESELCRLDIADGSRVWTRKLEDVALGPRSAAEGIVVAADGELAVRDVDTGERLRSLDNYDREAYAVAIADGTAYWLTFETLAAISLEDGTVEWRLDAEGCQEGLCVGQDTIVAPVEYEEFDLETTWPTIAAFDRETGDVRWYYHIDGFDVSFTTPPVLVEGAVYFAANTIDAVGALGDVPPADDSGLF